MISFHLHHLLPLAFQKLTFEIMKISWWTFLFSFVPPWQPILMVSPRSDVNTGQPSGRTRPHTNHRLAVPASGNLQQSNTLDSVALADDGPDQTFPACLLFTSGCHQRPTDWWHPIKNQNQDQNSDTRLMTSWSRHYQQDGIGHQRCQSGTGKWLMVLPHVRLWKIT